MSSPALPHPIDRFVEAVHKGDTKAFLAFFPKDGVVIRGGASRARMLSEVGATASSSVRTDDCEGSRAKEECGHGESRLEKRLLQRPVSLRVCAQRRTNTRVAHKGRVKLKTRWLPGFESTRGANFAMNRVILGILCGAETDIALPPLDLAFGCLDILAEHSVPDFHFSACQIYVASLIPRKHKLPFRSQRFPWQDSLV